VGRKVILAKEENCTGCRYCELACSSIKEGQCIPDRARIKVVQDSLQGWSRPVTCLQCEDPMCLAVCPAEAIVKSRTDTGEYFVRVDQERCVGCYRCVAACPFGAMAFFKESLATKCDLCGGEPKCVEFCFHDCLHFVELSDEEVVKRDKRIKSLCLKACREIGDRELFRRRERLSMIDGWS
jgi:carbon-monoxide dehydrogenase iron sulfur subunit